MSVSVTLGPMRSSLAARPVHGCCLPMNAGVLRQRGVLTADDTEREFMDMTARVCFDRLKGGDRLERLSDASLPVLPRAGFSCVVCGSPLLYGQDVVLVPLSGFAA